MAASSVSSVGCWPTCRPRSSPPSEVGLDLDVDEPHDTYAENAAAKADAYARASGLLTVADDSGIEVAALDWGPACAAPGGRGGRDADGCSRRSGTPPTGARGWCACWLSAVPGDARTARSSSSPASSRARSRRAPREPAASATTRSSCCPSGSTTAELPERREGPHQPSWSGRGGCHPAPAGAAGGD